MIPWIIILICIFLLKSYESQFQRFQKLLVLESNNLLSPHYIQASEDMNAIWKQLAKPEETFWILGIIEKSFERQVMAFYATDYEQVTFPLKLGKPFSVRDSGEAIVGMGVQTYKLSDGEYFDYDNVRYCVIGKFGIAEDSPLKNAVLLNDSALLEQPHVPLVFDGPHLDEISWLKGHSLGNKGVERWFNVTFIANWIRYMTWLVILCASVLAMYYYLIVTKESRVICMEIGVGARAIFRKDLWHITVVTFLITPAIAWAVSGKMLFLEFVISSAVIYVVLTAVYGVMFWQQITKETTHNV
jgi:hypothetical protein